MYCKGAASDAVAATTIEYLSASEASCSVLDHCPNNKKEDHFLPTSAQIAPRWIAFDQWPRTHSTISWLFHSLNDKKATCLTRQNHTLIRTIVPLLLVDYGVQRNRGFTSLTITNDQLTLTTTNGHHRVDTLDARLHGLVHRLTRDDTGGLDRGSLTFRVLDGALHSRLTFFVLLAH